MSNLPSGFSVAKALPFFAFAFAISLLPRASASPITVTYLAAGTETPVSTSNYESFSNLTKSGSSWTTHFGNSNPGAITGTYTGSVSIMSADQYGGAGGTGKYIAALGGQSYTLTFDRQVNYFGLWFSALDAGNEMEFYEGNTLVYSFTPQDFIDLVGACPSSTGFCGNPSGTFQGGDSSQQYAYLGFYDQAGTFDKIVFSEENGSGNFESDNQSVAFLTPPTPQGTVIDGASTPEPSSIVLLGTGLLGGAGLLRRRLQA